MIWDIVFWLALAYLAFTVVWRFFVVGLRKTQKKRGGTDVHAQGASLFFRGRALTVTAVLLVVVAFVMKTNPDIFRSGWSAEERIEVDHFVEALTLYAQANTLASQNNLNNEDWESVLALLQASKAEVELVSDKVLERLHPDLNAHLQEEFFPGIRVGGYGISHFVALRQKGKDTVKHYMEDSLTLGRTLLSQWNNWYRSHAEQIMKRVE